MPHSQRYVSDELSHFVGRTAKSDDERYDILVNKAISPARIAGRGAYVLIFRNPSALTKR